MFLCKVSFTPEARKTMQRVSISSNMCKAGDLYSLSSQTDGQKEMTGRLTDRPHARRWTERDDSGVIT